MQILLIKKRFEKKNNENEEVRKLRGKAGRELKKKDRRKGGTVKMKIYLSLCLIKHHAMKTCGCGCIAPLIPNVDIR
jgi:hypothetical protein